MCIHNVEMRYPAAGWRQRLELYFAGIGQGVNAGTLSRARLGDIAALEGLSDAELSARGLNRSEIPAHVFADLLGPG